MKLELQCKEKIIRDMRVGWHRFFSVIVISSRTFVASYPVNSNCTGREGGEEGDGEGARGPHQGALQEPASAEDQTQDEICGAARGVGFNSYMMRKADVH